MNDPDESTVPPPHVLDAFGVRGTPVPLSGGQGRSVRVGAFVFKPADAPDDQVEWAASVFERLAPGNGFRVPAPLRAPDGRSVVDGWTAAELLDGRPGPRGRWPELVTAARAFHAALRPLPRPAFLAARTHPWAVADRFAWGEQHVDVTPDLAEPLAVLLDLRRPVRPTDAQLVHGDLAGNVLFAPGRPPAVIDFSPYWRPPLFAEAIVAADGLLWFTPPPLPLITAHPHPDWRQLLIRALLFRLVAESRATPLSADPAAPARYARATNSVLTLTS